MDGRGDSNSAARDDLANSSGKTVATQLLRTCVERELLYARARVLAVTALKGDLKTLVQVDALPTDPQAKTVYVLPYEPGLWAVVLGRRGLGTNQ